jgi:hypothetical protein
VKMSSTWRAVMAGPPLGALVASIPNTGSRALFCYITIFNY